MCLFVCDLFCARLQVTWIDLQIFRRRGGVDGHGRQCTRHDVFGQGSRGGWGLDFGVKNSPSEMHWKIFRPPDL